MRIDGLFSLRSGEVLLPDGQPATLEVTELGTLRVPSGRLAVCDALWLQFPNVVPIPPGDHPVAVTIARVPEHYEYRGCREVSLSLILSEEPTVSVHPAVFERDSLDLDEQPIGGIAGVSGLYGVGTSRFATVAMADAEASAHSVPSEADRWLEEVLRPEGGEGWYSRMDIEVDGPLGTLLAALPGASDGENIAMLIARAHRLFPVLETRDAQGRATGIHIDLLVLGELSERLGAFDRANEYAAELVAEDEAEARRLEVPAEPATGRGLGAALRRIFGR